MDKKFPITWDRIRNHFTYSWWIYVLVLAVGIFGWNLIYTITRYQSPEHLKVEFYYTGSRIEMLEDIHQLMDEIHEDLFPEMEVVEYVELGLMNDHYSSMTLTMKTMNGEGDVYLMDEANFREQALNVMIDLGPYVESGEIDVGDLDVSSGYVTDPETGKHHLFGIPASHLKGFEKYGVFVQDFYLCIPALNGNMDCAFSLMNYFLTEMK
ncbi:MAG: hypothetical protein E7331_11140 [Clostridiales bacterium]|nr:hypothetical protein [Clostridiales bacterium]